ncbi:hypothetical protein ACFSQ7_20020 [Paenibacillus rhizoplanae]
MERVEGITGHLYKRSKGNSFFLTEMLKDLHRRGIIFFSTSRTGNGAGAWSSWRHCRSMTVWWISW